MNKLKILLIGQGIAGTLLAWSLQRRGAVVHLMEGDLPGSASPVAAGIINPVTGKRFVKSWRFDELFPVARSVYQTLERELGISIWQEQPILRLLTTAQEANDWAARCALPDYANYLGEQTDAGLWSPFLKASCGYGLIRQAARVEFSILRTAFREMARQKGLLLEKEMDHSELETLSHAYDRVVFCDGYRSAAHPLFAHLPWQLAKGEALLIRFPDESAQAPAGMLKKTMTLVPLDQGVYWAGGSYQWHYADLLPSPGERDFILHHLREMVNNPFEVIGHLAGVRPTVKDRRPLIGLLPGQPKIGIFNGLGTKGALLAPFWAEHFSAHLLDGAALDREVDIRRAP